MSHELTIREDGTAEMFSGSNIVPWHKLGTVIPGLATAKEAIQLAKLDWKANLTPVYVNGAKVDGYSAVTRSDNAKVLSIVGGRYSPIHNEDAFDFFDSVVGGGQAVYDTAGSLFGGKKVWIMAKVNGNLFLENRPEDKGEKMVMLYTSHDGSSGLAMQIVYFRPVCRNTISIALSGATNQIKIRHTKNFKAKVDEAAKALGLVSAYFDDLQAVLNTLDNKPMTKGEMIQFAEKLLPSTEDEVSTRTANNRATVVSLFDRGAGNRGQSRYDAFQSVTDFVTHHRATRTGDAGDEGESRFASAMFGSGAALSRRAMDLLVS